MKKFNRKICFYGLRPWMINELRPIAKYFKDGCYGFAGNGVRPEDPKLEAGDADVVVTVNGDDGGIVQHVHGLGKKIVLVQHAWEMTYYMARPIGLETYDLILTGSIFDQQRLEERYPDTKAICTGLPILDELIKYKKTPVEESYYLAPCLIKNYNLREIIDDQTVDFFYNEIPKLLDAKVLYKIHPNQDSGVHGNLDKTKLNIVEDDDRYNLIKNAKAIIASISFMVVEASVVGIPVITYPKITEKYNLAMLDRIDVPDGNQFGWYTYDFNGLGCGFDNIHYTDKQKELASMFPHDGKNAYRAAVEIAKI